MISQAPTATETSEQMNIVITGHVDHGKSTVIGRLLADTLSLPEGKIEQIKNYCEKNAKPFEYAFLIDALKDERAQGITIDVARVFFKSQKRNYIINDAPGHIEFLKNMVTGAARSDAAVIVIDAHEGIQENSRRHCYLLSVLGIHQIIVLVNKMDKVAYDEKIFQKIKDEFTSFMSEIGIKNEIFIPISGLKGENLIKKSSKMTWYQGQNFLATLDQFKKSEDSPNSHFRMFVQDIYRFSELNDDRRIIAGTVSSGSLAVGDTLSFYPSRKSSKIKSFESFPEQKIQKVQKGMAIGFTLENQIYITRGEIAFKQNESPPEVQSEIYANIFWLSKLSFVKEKAYTLKIGTNRVPFTLKKIDRIIDASTLKTKEGDCVETNEVAHCLLSLKKPLAFDLASNFQDTSRFVITEDYKICGGGSIDSFTKDKNASLLHEHADLRNKKWIHSELTKEIRSEKFHQKPALIIVTGDLSSKRKELAKKLERSLFLQGRNTYFIGLGNLLYGINSQSENKPILNSEKLFEKIGEIAYLLLDAGIIAVLSAKPFSLEHLQIIYNVTGFEHIEVVWVGDHVETDLPINIQISSREDESKAIESILDRLMKLKIIPRG